MERIRIEFTFDYVDPGSYLVGRLLARWEREAQVAVAVEWRPLELRPPSVPHLDPSDAAWGSLTGAVEAMAGAQGIPFTRPSFIPWTRKAHELALHAREQGRFEAIHWAIFEGYFERGGDIGRVDVLVEMAGAHGLREAEVRTVLGVDRFLPAVEEWRRKAFAAGIGGVPTVDVGGRRLEGLSSVAGLFSFLDDAVRASDRDRG